MRAFLISLCLLGSAAVWAQGGPPKDPKATRTADLVELVKLDSTVKLDIRYAGSNNFLGKPVYKEARAFLQRPAAEALLAVHKELARSGYGLLIHDGYRPWAITKLFWDMTSGFQREFVADPKTGSKHNRGCAVDLTIYDLATGKVVEMPGSYDEMTPRSYPDYSGGPPEAAPSAISCARRWKATASPWSRTSGGTSTTRIGRSIQSSTLPSARFVSRPYVLQEPILVLLHGAAVGLRLGQPVAEALED